MAQLKITAVQAATLVALRSLPADSADRKAAKKGVYDAARAAFGIPADVKLKVEIDDRASPDFLVLKDKATGRELVGNSLGKFSHIAPAPVTPSLAAATPAPAADSRFTASAGGLKVIRKAVLMDLLRDAYADGDAMDTTALPGMPGVPVGGLVLDNQTGDLYFA